MHVNKQVDRCLLDALHTGICAVALGQGPGFDVMLRPQVLSVESRVS